MGKLIQGILTDTEARNAPEIEKAAIDPGTFEPWH
jgi:hypothetical protein